MSEAAGLLPGNPRRTRSILRGECLQHPFTILIIERAIAIPLQAGDRHRMMGFFGLLPRTARPGKCRGHGSAQVAMGLILSSRAGESRGYGNIAVLPLVQNQVRSHGDHHLLCNRLWMTCVAV